MAQFRTDDINAAYVPATAQITEPVADPTAQQFKQATDFLTNVGSIFVANANEREKNTVVDQYAKDLGKLNLALEQGASPTEVSRKRRSITNKYLSDFPTLTKEITDVHRSFFDTTGIGEAQKEEDADQKLRRELESAATKEGFVFGTMTETEKEQGVLLYQQAKRQEAELSRLTKVNAELRAQKGEVRAEKREGRQATEYALKMEARSALKSYANTSLQQFESFVNSNRVMVERGLITTEEASRAINARLVEVQRFAATQAPAGGEFISSLIRPFQSVVDNATDLMSGKITSDIYSNKLKSLMSKNQLMTVEQLDDRQMQVLSLSTLLRGSVAVDKLVEQDIVAPMISALDEKNTKPVDVIGKGGEAPARFTKTAKDLIRDLRTGNIDDTDGQGKKEVSTLINKMLKGAEIYSSTTDDPRDYASMADFIASPEYAYAINEGLVGRDASIKMHDVFRYTYNSEVVKTVKTDLENSASIFGDRPIADWVRPKWTGSALVFESIEKPGFGLITTGIPADTQRKVLRDLNKDAQAITTLVKMVAHINGNTDYTKAWEDSKKDFLPMFNYDEGASK